MSIGIIDLATPVGSDRSGKRTVFIYVCPECKNKVRVGASSFSGKRPTPSVGGIYCPQCELANKTATGSAE